MARGICKAILIDNAIEHAKSYRNFSRSRNALLHVFRLIANTIDSEEHNLDQLNKARSKALIVFASIIQKQSIQSQPNNQNSATTLLLGNKLKPTSDGKTDSKTDNKGSIKSITFFINLWNLIHVKPQNRAFI